MATSAAKKLSSVSEAAVKPRRKLTIVDPSDQERRSFIQGFIEDLPDEFLMCRELGHNWAPWTAGRHEDGGYVRTLRCPRCLTRKHQDLTSTGMIHKTYYTHPDGYLIQGVGQLAGTERGTLRLESVVRTIRKIDAKNATAKKAPAKKSKAK